MSQLAVGKDVVSFCSRCKLALAAIIVVLDAKGAPGKVQCNTCKSTQKFKDPSKAAAPKRLPARSKITGKRIVSARPNAEVWQDLMNGHSGPSVKYATTNVFNKGDVIDHPNFGLGVVERLIDSNKIEVIFKVECKTLVHNLK
jgi:hypothetical protein